MNAENTTDTPRVYDRAFLLSPEKRNQVMALWEEEQYGLDSYADAEYVQLYGMPPAEWYQRGIRLLARTTVECVRDALSNLIGQDVAQVVYPSPPATKFVVMDPFAGSCNSLYWLLRHVQGECGIAFELDPLIFGMTKRNLAALDTAIELLHGDFRALLPNYRFAANYRLIVFVAPPWGDALNAQTGLDLRRTQPPIRDVLDFIESIFGDTPLLYVIQVHERVEPGSLVELESRFERSAMRIYNINTDGMRHGVLLGRCRWQP